MKLTILVENGLIHNVLELVIFSMDTHCIPVLGPVLEILSAQLFTTKPVPTLVS